MRATDSVAFRERVMCFGAASPRRPRASCGGRPGPDVAPLTK